jgi:hypothetical protein
VLCNINGTEEATAEYPPAEILFQVSGPLGEATLIIIRRFFFMGIKTNKLHESLETFAEYIVENFPVYQIFTYMHWNSNEHMLTWNCSKSLVS